ncbi:MAG: hypothetical protein A3J28_16865 [Acidobacteria bacterium RIFCSPLOWO2_12_FULL_60_22]|nr:MAG: hypothetical protein A3J28_16865 [Acidobacteria bacterium RIFCSPLOWO2_12_FULL_60_22]
MRNLRNAALLLLALSGPVFAQSRGTINGRVTDGTGAVVPRAAVTVTNTNTAVARNTVTNPEGLFSVAALPPGAYDVKVEMAGFAPSARQGVTLVTDTTLTLDFALGVAGTTEIVEVTGEAPLVETTQSGMSGALRTSEVESLPILNRNFMGLVTLVPGARPTTQANSNKIAFGGGIGFGGGTGRNVQLEVDGLAARDDVVGGTMFNLTLEGIREFKVLPHEFGAQYGRTNGGVVVVATRAGTNQLHGSAFAYGRNDAMTAVDYFSDPANRGLGNPPYDRQQFGGSFGGPIQKDRLFFFGAVERVQENRVKPFPANAYNQAVTLKQTLTGLTSCPLCVDIGNSIVPSPFAPQTVRDLMYTLKGDYQINSNHALFVRWAQQRINNFNDLIVNTGAPPHPDIDPSGSNVNNKGRAYSIVGSHTWVLGSSSVNTFAVQGNHLLTSQTCDCGTAGPRWASRNLQFPSLQLGVSQNATDQDFYQTTIQFKDDFAHQMGKHALKVGGDFSFFPTIGVSLAGAGGVHQGATTFFHDPSVIVGSQAAWAANPATCTTAAFAPGSPTACGPYRQGFLTPGAVSQIIVGTIMLGGPPGKTDTQGQKQIGLYIQDDWKVTPGFTLNLALRYDLNINWYNQREYANNRTYLALKAIGSPYGALPKTPTKDFSPRVGFAWDIGGNGKNVLRAGFGIFFDQMLVISNFPSALQEKSTLENISANFVNTGVGQGQLATYIYGVSPLPAGPTPGLTQLRPGASTNGAWLDPDLTDPYNEQFHIGYTRQFSANTVVSADFTHILGLRDFRILQINPLESTSWDPNAASFNTCGATGAFRRLQCQFQTVLGDPRILGGINLTTTMNRSQYNELTVHFEQRSRSVAFQASYTLSSANGFGGAISGATGGIGPLVALIPFQPFGESEWGPTVTDERHRAVLSGVFNLPWGIQVSPIFQIASARPYNMLAGTDWTGAGQLVTVVRPWVNSSGQVVAPFASGAQPASVNYLRGTATWNWDTRVTKSFNLGNESRKVGFFAEFYNISNKANFGNAYNGNVLSPTFKQPLGYLNNGLAYPTSRQLQLGARITF